MELAPDLLLYTTLSSAISCCRPGFYIDHCDVMSSFDILSAEFDTLVAENIIFTGGYVRYGIFSHGKWWHALNCRAFPISSQIGRWKQHRTSAAILTSAACVVEHKFTQLRRDLLLPGSFHRVWHSCDWVLYVCRGYVRTVWYRCRGIRWHALNCRAFLVSSQIGRWKHPNSDNLTSCSMCCRAELDTISSNIATWFFSSTFFPQSLTLLWLNNYIYRGLCVVWYGCRENGDMLWTIKLFFQLSAR